MAERGHSEGAIKDYTAVIQSRGVTAELMARALLGRGEEKGKLGNVSGEIADYTAAIKLPGLSTELRSLHHDPTRGQKKQE